MDHRKWLGSEYWHGHPKDIHKRIPLEFWLQHMCSQVSNQHFARMRTYSQDHKNMILSLYVEYCACGDLGGIQYSYLDTPLIAFPEPALWMVFQRLVECCLIMRQGGIDTVNPDWQQIVHRDIKPRTSSFPVDLLGLLTIETGNIFMDEPTRQYFPLYPTPKMVCVATSRFLKYANRVLQGDFGLAIQTDENDPLNPSMYNHGAGTRPYKAPEQLSFVDSATDEPVDDWKLLDYTNVYGKRLAPPFTITVS